MTNSAFHTLCYEFNLNYTYNDKFREYVNNNYTSHIDSIYGTTEFSTDDMKSARTYWKKTYKKIAPNSPWLKDSLCDSLLLEIKSTFPNADAVYVDKIIETVGEDGFYYLIKGKKIELCGFNNGRYLYAL